MLRRGLYTSLLTCGILLSNVTVAYCLDDIFSQAQEMYDDAYEQAQEEFDQAYQQAQSEFDAAYEEAQEEVNEALGISSDTTDDDTSGEAKAPVTGTIKNYVGRNAATFGYYSLGGDRMDDGYGGTLDTLKLVLVADDGSYIDIEDDEILKQYVVIAQNIEADSEITFNYGDYGLCEHQTYDEIELLCKKVDEDTANPVLTTLTMISPSPDMSTQYIKDYVGRNLASIGYTGLDGEWHDEYNGTFNTIDLIIITDDGSFIDPEDRETQKQYVVTSQNPVANSEAIFNYGDYGLVDSQTYSEIELYVSKLE